MRRRFCGWNTCGGFKGGVGRPTTGGVKRRVWSGFASAHKLERSFCSFQRRRCDVPRTTPSNTGPPEPGRGSAPRSNTVPPSSTPPGGARRWIAHSAIAAALAGAYFVACGSSEGGSPVTAEDLPRLLADAICNNIGPCCEQAGFPHDRAQCHAAAERELRGEAPLARATRSARPATGAALERAARGRSHPPTPAWRASDVDFLRVAEEAGCGGRYFAGFADGVGCGCLAASASPLLVSSSSFLYLSICTMA